MIIEDYVFPNGTKTKKLSPSDGYKYVTDGVNYCKSVILGKGVPIERWHDTNDEPPQPPEPVDPEDKALADVIDDAETMANELIGG